MRDLDLLVLGDANPDLVLTGDVDPAFGQAEKLVDGARLVIGGSGAITACGAARLGLRAAFVGVLGDDVFGRFMLEALGEHGVDTRGCVVDPARPTGLSVVLSRGDDRAILTSVGAIADLRGELVDRDLLGSARHVHVSSYFLQPRLWPDLPTLFDEAHDAGATTSVDPNWDPSEVWEGGLPELLERTDCFFPNSYEARAITGIDDVDIAAAALAEPGALVAVKFGQGRRRHRRSTLDGGGARRAGGREVSVTDGLLQIVERNRRGERAGIYSICSADRFVLQAGMAQAARDGSVVTIESTCNQVNQFGGYTGMAPADFRRFVGTVAAEMGLPETSVVLGGDHLGPYVWRAEPATSAMEKARELVRGCVLAGYTKLHLDTSMRCADDPDGPLDEHLVTERAVELCRAAEDAHAELPAGRSEE